MKRSIKLVITEYILSFAVRNGGSFAHYNA